MYSKKFCRIYNDYGWDYTPKNNLVNTNVKIIKKDCLIFQYSILERLYDIEYIKNIL